MHDVFTYMRQLENETGVPPILISIGRQSQVPFSSAQNRSESAIKNYTHPAPEHIDAVFNQQYESTSNTFKPRENRYTFDTVCKNSVVNLNISINIEQKFYRGDVYEPK